MAKRMVAIVGRPNVGKSTLFNTLAGEKIAIVKDTPGVTRDRIYADTSWLNYRFTIIDTGGIDTGTEDIIMRSMNYEKYESYIYEFYNLGIGDPYPISASGKLGLGDMLQQVVAYFGDNIEDEDEDDTPRIAVIGKPNTGKSSIINRLLGTSRLIVSDIAGTTRDAIDTKVKDS